MQKKKWKEEKSDQKKKEKTKKQIQIAKTEGSLFHIMVMATVKPIFSF